VAIKRALISVSDKSGIMPFAAALANEFGVEILSTGGTARALRENGIPVTDVSAFTGSPEILDGRVKTLHPAVHGGILCRRDHAEDCKLIENGSIRPIDLVVVNLYPFRETIAKPDVTLEDAIENIDIGGPTMIRSSAKNHAWVAIVTDPADYAMVLDEMRAHGGAATAELRQRLAVKAFRHTATYDAAIDTYLSQKLAGELVHHSHYVDGKTLRYGENPHQTPAHVYRNPSSDEPSLVSGQLLHGKEMSYNNYVDANSALAMVKDLADSIAVSVIKHNNPAGIATGETLAEALERAWFGDPLRTTPMGSVIAVTRPVDLAAAEFLKGRFVEVMVAPGYSPEALAFLSSKSKDIRLMQIAPLGTGTPERFMTKTIAGGLLEQPLDTQVIAKWEVPTKLQFPKSLEALAHFAVIAVKHTRSNAIILAREYRSGYYELVGLGAGQPNRVDSLRALAGPKAKANFGMEFDEKRGIAVKPGDTKESYVARQFGNVVLASDAFFPFDDSPVAANSWGIRYLVQPGGSLRDNDVIAACDKLGIAMALTGMRHFTH
jgi:phosphoribosylaminoimidazolecarboxamide formyltransferase/IMP cyclohydrolase